MIFVFPILSSQNFIINSFPLVICKFGRVRYYLPSRGNGANYGKCTSKKKPYFSCNVHSMITLERYITTFEITPPSTNDRKGLRDIVDG